MSAARRLARLAKKGGGGVPANLQKVTEALAGLKQLGGTLEGMIPEAQAGLEATKTAADKLAEKLHELEYRLERQRIVSLRMCQSIGFMDIDVDDADDLLALQERYEAEYDAMRFLQWVASLVHREEP